jgi:2,3-diketo-5-methylthiopentyl-1-phosphate enolase
MVPQILRDFGTNVIINAGTGIHEVEGGAVSGVKAFQTAMHAEVLA